MPSDKVLTTNRALEENFEERENQETLIPREALTVLDSTLHVIKPDGRRVLHSFLLQLKRPTWRNRIQCSFGCDDFPAARVLHARKR